AWVGLLAFRMAGVRVPPPLFVPGLTTFPETNLRTYVVAPDGSAGLWFFSLEAARLAFVVGARSAIGVPYCWAAMSVTERDATVRYRSRRRWPGRAGIGHDITVTP